MSLKSKLFTVFTIAGATIAFSTISMAQDRATTPTTGEKVERHNKEMGRGMGPGRMGGREGGQGMMKRHGGGMRMMLRDLDLTDAQKLQIQSIMAAKKPDQANREEMRTLRMAKRMGVLTAVQQERMTAIRTANQAKGQLVHEQILAVLTPEQKAKIEARKQQMQQRMQERKQMRQQKFPATGTTPPTKDN